MLRSVFRPGHNLTLLTLAEQSHWRVDDTDGLGGLTARRTVPGALLRYAFHINLFGNDGFALGTAVGGSYVPGNLAPNSGGQTDETFRPRFMMQFPSLSAAWVHSLGDQLRFSAWGEYAAAYLPALSVRRRPASQAPDEPPVKGRMVDLSLAPDSWSVGVQSDVFFDPFWGLAIWTGYRSVLSSCLGGCTSSAFANDVRFQVESWQLGVGLTWQAGTFFDE